MCPEVHSSLVNLGFVIVMTVPSNETNTALRIRVTVAKHRKKAKSGLVAYSICLRYLPIQ